ncbi:class I SAM-dependent methyltransferase [Flavobacterium sp. GT3R68]|uniref:class I SAM-dependent methyltransferase n=1 Tax=Flavobacterium sp. GT3R68 TaxID=2594437 RepID=UPI000F8855A0|nr:class I SAM-dependent methyltransferase [Flavobacterium sp. GT3R68]RTY92299.1 class I SAM-dependent methyltransferase [Flavobacterium sp. GSN2]TRW92535.1 class I SAM-dependent methyltransferase [Flavobacterium sp. GT3R68]
MIKKIYYSLANILMNRILKSKVLFLRNFYWNLNAKNIDRNWGDKKNDFSVIEGVIKNISPKRILDIGCGSGRCFPLYKSLNIEKVFAQDVSKNAIKLCKEKHPDLECSFILMDIEKLKFEENYFDLILSTRVLAAILPDNIDRVIRKITEISLHVYINEMSDSDFMGESLYWFKHDYDTLFEKYNFKIADTGIISVLEEGDKQFNQTWKLYKKQL